MSNEDTFSSEAKTPESHHRPKRHSNLENRPTQNLCSPSQNNDQMMVNPAPNELRLVLLGKTGAGKSATGNAIVGKKVFDDELSMSSVTKECRSEVETVEGRELLIIDTPGFFDTNLTEKEIKQEIIRCLTLSFPGPHAFLLVIPIERYTQEQQRTVELILEMFDEEITHHTILIFSHADRLHGKSFEEFISKQEPPIQKLMEKFGSRFVAFDNTNPTNRDQVKRLLEEMEDLLLQNQNRHFSNELTKVMEEAEMIIQEKMAERTKEIKEEVKKMADNRWSAFITSLNKERQEIERKKKSIQIRIKQIEVDIKNEERKVLQFREYLKNEQGNLRRFLEREMKEEEERLKREEKEKKNLEIWIQEEEQRRLTGEAGLSKFLSLVYNKQMLFMLTIYLLGLGCGSAPMLLSLLFPAAPVVEAGLSATYLANLLGVGGGFALRAAGVTAAALPKLAAMSQCSIQ